MLFGRGRVLFFAVGAGATPLPKQQKITHDPARTAKKTKTRPPKQQKENLPHRSTPKLDFKQKCEGAPRKGACCVFAVWAGCVFHFLLFGRGACFISCRLGGCVFHFLLFGRGARFLFCCSGGGRVFFAVRPETDSFTGLPGWALRGLTTKKTKQLKKKGFRKSLLMARIHYIKSSAPLPYCSLNFAL